MGVNLRVLKAFQDFLVGCRVSTCRWFRAFGVSNVEVQDAISSNCRRPVLKGFRALTSPRAGPCTQVVCDLAFGLKVPT